MIEQAKALEDRVLRVVHAVLEVPVEADTEMIGSGVLDSLSFVDLLVRLEEEFSIQIEMADLEVDDFQDARSIARHLSRAHDLP